MSKALQKTRADRRKLGKLNKVVSRELAARDAQIHGHLTEIECLKDKLVVLQDITLLTYGKGAKTISASTVDEIIRWIDNDFSMPYAPRSALWIDMHLAYRE